MEEIISKSFERRIKERHFWVRLGWVFLVPGFALLFISTIAALLGTSFSFVNTMNGLSLLGILLGAIFILFFGRLGWSESKVFDFLLNRLSIILMTGGIIVMVSGATFFGSVFSEGVSYGHWIAIAGTILWILGVRFQSPHEK